MMRQTKTKNLTDPTN